MPRIPVDECPAGPEMDAAVAKALGWHCGWGGWWEDEEGRIQKPACVGCNGKSTWAPSEDIAAAWELWTRLCTEWFYAKLLFIKDLHVKANLYRNATAMQCDNPSIMVMAENGPLAICRAFLKANGVEFVETAE